MRPAIRPEFIVREATLDECSRIDVSYAKPQSERQHADVLVAVDANTGDLLGSVTLITNGGPIARISQPGEAEVRPLAVAPAVRRRAVGAALVLDCIDGARAAGCRAVVLYTQPSMTAAHRLYERMGFKRAPQSDFKSEDGVRMLVYKMALSWAQTTSVCAPLNIWRRQTRS